MGTGMSSRLRGGMEAVEAEERSYRFVKVGGGGVSLEAEGGDRFGTRT